MKYWLKVISPESIKCNREIFGFTLQGLPQKLVDANFHIGHFTIY